MAHYGLFRTEHGTSPHVSAGNALFTLIGFMGMYTILASSICFWFPAKSITDPRKPRRQAMQTIWFMLIAVMIAVYVVLDGFDLGAGIIHLL